MNVKKQFIFAVILITVLLICGCTGAESTIQVKYLIGEVVVVGNEPFASLAIQTGPSSTILLDCDKETKDFLLSNQGKTVKIFYEKIDDDKAPKLVYVKKYEIMSKEIQ